MALIVPGDPSVTRQTGSQLASHRANTANGRSGAARRRGNFRAADAEADLHA